MLWQLTTCVIGIKMADGGDILPNPHDRDPSQEELADMYGRLADYAAGSYVPDEHCEHDNAVASSSHQISIHTTNGSGRRPIPGDESAALQLGESHYWLVQNGPSPQIVSESHTFAGTLIPTSEGRLDNPVAKAGGSSIVSFDMAAKQLKDGYAPFVSFTWTPWKLVACGANTLAQFSSMPNPEYTRCGARSKRIPSRSPLMMLGPS